MDKMASVKIALSEEQLHCSICLEIFNDPVTTSCGHSFCKTCLQHHWDHSQHYQCPLCKEDFSSRPHLKTNTFISEMVSQFKGRQEKPEQEEPSDSAEAVHVPCDVCCGKRLRALKSCLVCLASYCSTHLEPHLNTQLQRHQLICPVENLEERICPKHNKPLELLCQKEKMLICFQCIFSEHKDHKAVPLREESERQQAELQSLIQQRQQKIQEIQDSVKVNNKDADQEMAQGVKVFTTLMQSVEKSFDQFKEKLTGKQKRVEDRAAELMEKIEQEIGVLQQRKAEMELVSDDHFSFVQTFSSERMAPVLKDWSKVTVIPLSFEGLMSEAVSDLDKTLRVEIKKVSEAELRRLQQFEVNVTLDPDTAHPCLVLSADNKQVYYRTEWKILSDLPQRFCTCPCVLGKQKFSTGRFYFQVKVKGKNGVFLGVARESVERKGRINVAPVKGYWAICLNNNQYTACAESVIPLALHSPPEIIGIFVDYSKGVVSFYDVDRAALLYSFTECLFFDSLLPFFHADVMSAAALTVIPVKKERK